MKTEYFNDFKSIKYIKLNACDGVAVKCVEYLSYDEYVMMKEIQELEKDLLLSIPSSKSKSNKLIKF